MPKRTDIHSILIIGAGPIVIGQACEFDYSGTQACKALREEGYRVILVNSNPATIMTDPETADVTYIEPITPEMVEKIIIKEQPDALLPTMGGQTALNCAKALAENGVLHAHNVQLIGASLDAINKAEDRRLFAEAMARIGLECPKQAVVHSMETALSVLAEVGLPAIIRPSFTMGGAGGGIAYNREEFIEIVRTGLEMSPVREVLIDESVLGWKEYEMEVVRDKADNCIIVCSIENVDPMGVHTGDSITVAPAMTLTDKEYQIMRDASIAVLREIGVDTGGSNVQFAVNPENGRMIVIEMNPRVSRSSALASKATGFPIAKVAAKLAVGYTLDEITNDVTRATPASFEPSIDYIVTKIPRFAFEKFPEADQMLTTSMKSVGEAMAMGRNFAESLQKALRSLETGLTGLNPVIEPCDGALEEIKARLARPTPDRLLIVADAFRHGMSVEEIFDLSNYDPWFLEQIKEIVRMEQSIIEHGLPTDRRGMLYVKKFGFSDERLAQLTKKEVKAVTSAREQLKVMPVYKRIDTCAGEFDALTAYMYSTYEGDGQKQGACEAEPSDREKIIILGGGPNRIGQGIEFDYCCVHAAYALSEAGYETIMVNCNPETVSTDYDTSDRLYFEPLTTEDVINLIRREQDNGFVRGVVVQFGGQTPLKLAKALEAAQIPIIGTSPDAIDLAEDRERFQKLLYSLDLKQPDNRICHGADEVIEQAESIGYPIVVRPSYVLGGRAMQIIYDAPSLQEYLHTVFREFKDNPILLDSFLKDAVEIDVDALCDGHQVYIAGIMQHIEEAGIHSGDSACSLPAYNLGEEMMEELCRQTIMLAKALHVVGLLNIQFAIKEGEIYILEVNPRASRTVPFVAKATGMPIAKYAARMMAGEKLADLGLIATTHAHLMKPLPFMAVKEAVLPFKRFPGVDVILGPEMKSTGEVMGIDKDFARAFAKAYLATGSKLPLTGKVFVSVKDSDKTALVDICRDLIDLGFSIVATQGTQEFLQRHQIQADRVNKVRQGRPHIVDLLKDGHVQFVINTTEGVQSVKDSASIRQTSLAQNIAYSTTMEGTRALIEAIACIKKDKGLDVCSLQEYHSA
ncbi:MAG: carbamoyl-phosphate synthase large subunit [Alphaproteobacteria bacterium]|nr:MAG: carbamoyl-phosphate synthase large subunit [Alphaproteobacteria bacterium]TAF76926.1 MAG: carbamoyl-phosphate synthase large subunit [Alphaproteobacteria bacterium]